MKVQQAEPQAMQDQGRSQCIKHPLSYATQGCFQSPTSDELGMAAPKWCHTNLVKFQL